MSDIHTFVSKSGLICTRDSLYNATDDQKRSITPVCSITSCENKRTTYSAGLCRTHSCSCHCRIQDRNSWRLCTVPSTPNGICSHCTENCKK